jgi:glutathione synthase
MKKIAIQMDKIEDIDINFDSSFLIGIEAQKRNYEIFYYNPQELLYNEGLIQANGYYIELVENNTKYFKYLSKKILVNLQDFKYIFIRQDPPFDMNYITSTYLLDYLPSSTIVINNPTSVRNFSEKISAFQFKEFMPPTIVSQNVESIKNFLIRYEDIVTKPLYGNGGEGIYRYTIQDNKLKDIFQNLTILEEPLMVQKYIPEINEGDRRIILLDGEYVGSVARMPMKNSIKANFHAGGTAKKTGLVRRDKEICSALRKILRDTQLFFVGIDIIGDYLTEINVTSPTGMKQINVLNNTNLEKIFWDKLETKYNLV